jgi:hypothetical protein
LTYEVSLAVVDFLQQRVAAIRRALDRRIFGTGPDFNFAQEIPRPPDDQSQVGRLREK